jgi:hypothetical protein
MKDNIKAGSDIHAGDGGYSIGTQEKYDEFVKVRNQSLGKTPMKDMIIPEWVGNVACFMLGFMVCFTMFVKGIL